MRWKTKKDPPPKEGDERTRVLFAWWPTDLDDNVTVWLSFYAVRERLFVLPATDLYGPHFIIPREVWIRVRAAPVEYYG